MKKLLCLLALLSVACFAPAAEHPDIVFFLVDDLGSQDVGWRNSEIKTPHLDKLAKAGVRLENFYVQPLCSPTRAALLTGRYPMRYGLQVGVVRPWADYGLPLEERTLPSALKEAGYTTAICGKWHLGSFDTNYWPNARGFDKWYGHLFGALDCYTHERDGKFDWYRNGVTNRDEGYSTHLLAREAVQIIAEQPKKKPLFLYMPFNAVHSPLQCPEKYKAAYAAFPEPRRTYAGMLSAVDEAVGQVVAAIEAGGRRKNTLFIFSSDNGGPSPGRVTSNGSLRAGKGTLYEGGTRTCAFATWDGHLKAGTQSDALMHISDWYPTLLKLAGASLKQPRPLDSFDLWPALTKGKPSPRTEILYNTMPQSGALRVGDWKIVLNGNAPAGADEEEGGATKPKGGKKAEKKAAQKADPQTELFNLALDPNEKNDLAAQNPDKLKELRARYEAIAKQAATPKNQKP